MPALGHDDGRVRRGGDGLEPAAWSAHLDRWRGDLTLQTLVLEQSKISLLIVDPPTVLRLNLEKADLQRLEIERSSLPSSTGDIRLQEERVRRALDKTDRARKPGR